MTLQATFLLLISSLLFSCSAVKESFLKALNKDEQTRLVKIPLPSELANYYNSVPENMAYIPVLRSIDRRQSPEKAIGYAILCQDETELKTLLEGIGADYVVFKSQNPAYPSPDQVTADVAELNWAAQPLLLCPSDQKTLNRSYKSYVSQGSYFVQTSQTSPARVSDFAELGCKGLLEGLGLNADGAVRTDIVALAQAQPASIRDANCVSGQTFNLFVKQCEVSRANMEEAWYFFNELFTLKGLDPERGSCTALWNATRTDKKLDLADRAVSDISPVQYLTELQELDLSQNSVSSLESLSPLRRLAKLRLTNNLIDDLSPLKGLTFLSSLDLTDNSDITDLSALSRMAVLSELKLKGSSVTDLLPLRDLKKLKTLEIDVERIAGNRCPADAQSKVIRDICGSTQGFVRFCEDARASNNKDKIATIAGIASQVNKAPTEACAVIWAEAEKLNKLDLSNRTIRDLEAISYLQQLTSLNLSGNAVSDIKPLAGLLFLTDLNLSGNKELKDIAGLSTMERLVNIDLTGTGVEDSSALNKLPFLKTVQADWSQVDASTCSRSAASDVMAKVCRALQKPIILTFDDGQSQRDLLISTTAEATQNFTVNHDLVSEKATVQMEQSCPGTFRLDGRTISVAEMPKNANACTATLKASAGRLASNSLSLSIKVGCHDPDTALSGESMRAGPEGRDVLSVCKLVDKRAVWESKCKANQYVFNGSCLNYEAKLAVGNSHSCHTNGETTSCWGTNEYGELGKSGIAYARDPVRVEGLGAGIVDLTAGPNFTCALNKDGKVFCWGLSGSGQTGQPGNDSRLFTPSTPQGLKEPVISIAAGYEFACAVYKSGRMACWGGNSFGTMGNGKASMMDPPNRTAVNVINIPAMKKAYASGRRACALSQAGELYCWGLSNDMQRDPQNPWGGNWIDTIQKEPKMVTGFSNRLESASIRETHLCAVIEGGDTMFCQGRNLDHELGMTTRGPGSGYRESPMETGFSEQRNFKIVSVETMASGTCFVKDNGNYTCFGTPSDRWMFQGHGLMNEIGYEPMETPTNVKSLATGDKFKCALDRAGDVYCWGNQKEGRLGNGSDRNEVLLTPAKVKLK